MKKSVISLSGGMDSTSLLLHLLAKGDEVFALSFNYGQRHSVELDRVKKNIEYLSANSKISKRLHHKIVDISFIGDLYDCALLGKGEIPEGHYSQENQKQTVVYNRNAIFSSIVFGYALSISGKNKEEIDICLGVHAGDFSVYPDCREEFFIAIENAFKLGNWDSEVINNYLPYLNINKEGILKDAIKSCTKLNLNFNIIFKNTNTCYKPNKKGESCGKCGSCSERIEAFINLDLKDPVKYVEKDWNKIKKHTLSILKK